MTDNEALNAMLSRYLDQRIGEIERGVQGILQSENPEEALNQALGEHPIGLREAFADKIKQVEPDGPYIPELGRKISRAESLELLENWQGTLSDEYRHQPPTVEGVELTGDGALAALQAAWEADRQSEAQARQAAEQRFATSNVTATPSAR